jgi:Domain of unknown function (DUF4349)/Protein of unknown function (DUF2510)
MAMTLDAHASARSGPQRRRPWLAAAAAVVLVAGLAACAGDDESSSDGAATTAAPAATAAKPSAAPAKPTAKGESAGSQVVTGSVPEGESATIERSVIYTADMTVRVQDVRGATDQATKIVVDAGGYLFGQQSTLEGTRESKLTFKVPPKQFRPVMDAIADLGSPVAQNVNASDVTDQVVDLEGRLLTAQTSLDRVRDMLARATTTSDILKLEPEVAKREAEVESLQGKLRVLEAQVDDATLDVVLTEQAKAADPEVSEDLPAVLDALKTGWVAFLSVLQVVGAVLAFVLPFLPFFVLAWLGWRWYRRRQRNKPAPPPEPPRPIIAAGWRPDPSGAHQIRYWDGWEWTANVSDRGVVSWDPIEQGEAVGTEEGEPVTASSGAPSTES